MRDFISLYEKLDNQCGYYSRHFGHLMGLLNNDDWLRVVDNSMTGRVLLLGNSEVTNALILFNTRMFDIGRDTYTLKSLSRLLPNEDETQQHHLARMADIGIEYELEPYFEARTEFIYTNRRLRGNATEAKLRQLRDHVLAHNIEPEIDPDRATLNDLLELTSDVFDLVDLAGYLVRSSRGVYSGFSERSKQETRMLYSALPKLAEIEAE